MLAGLPLLVLLALWVSACVDVLDFVEVCCFVCPTRYAFIARRTTNERGASSCLAMSDSSLYVSSFRRTDKL